MKIGDYFTEFDRILSLLLIALLCATVGHRAVFITEYAQMTFPITTVAGANKLIFGISLLENEKQVGALLPPRRRAMCVRDANSCRPVPVHHHHPRAPEAALLLRGPSPHRARVCRALLICRAGRGESQRAKARNDCDERRCDIAHIDLRRQH